MALTQDVIVDAALAVVDQEGWDALSMRRLAVALDVWPMAVYRHFADKDALMAAVAEAAARRVRVTGRGRGARLRALAREARGLRPTPALVEAARDAGAPDDLTARAFVGAACGFEGDDDEFAAAVELLIAGLER
jgi:AcrR family transcriptional regulator